MPDTRSSCVSGSLKHFLLGLMGSTFPFPIARLWAREKGRRETPQRSKPPLKEAFVNPRSVSQNLRHLLSTPCRWKTALALGVSFSALRLKLRQQRSFWSPVTLQQRDTFTFSLFSSIAEKFCASQLSKLLVLSGSWEANSAPALPHTRHDCVQTPFPRGRWRHLDFSYFLSYVIFIDFF